MVLVLISSPSTNAESPSDKISKGRRHGIYASSSGRQACRPQKPTRLQLILIVGTVLNILHLGMTFIAVLPTMSQQHRQSSLLVDSITEHAVLVDRTHQDGTTIVAAPTTLDAATTKALQELWQCPPKAASSPILLKRRVSTINDYEYSYSRFTDIFPMDSQNALHFVVMSHRADNAEVPLRALIHSLLRHASVPVALHIVTGAQSIQQKQFDWLVNDLDSPHFQVHLYNYERLGYLRAARQLTQYYGFRSKHRGMPYTLVKPFVSNLPFPRGTAIERVLLVDDDVVFWNDPAELFDVLPADKLALSCPTDPRRVNKYHTRTQQPHNGHATRYCNSGMVHVPILHATRRAHRQFGTTNAVLDMFLNATQQMTAEYPTALYSTSDQQIYNRVFATHEHDMGNIPCYWHCDYNSCRHGPTKCFNCPEVRKPKDGSAATHQCQAYHYNNHAYELEPEKLKMDAPAQEFAYYLHGPASTREYLRTQFWPRVGHCDDHSEASLE